MFLALAIEAGEPEVIGIDYTVRTLAQAGRSPALERPMRRISDLGSGYVIIPLNLALLGFFLLRGLRNGHFGCRSSPPAPSWSRASGSRSRTARAPRAYGFPSGHVTGAVVFFGALLFLLST